MFLLNVERVFDLNSLRLFLYYLPHVCWCFWLSLAEVSAVLCGGIRFDISFVFCNCERSQKCICRWLFSSIQLCESSQHLSCCLVLHVASSVHGSSLTLSSVMSSCSRQLLTIHYWHYSLPGLAAYVRNRRHTVFLVTPEQHLTVVTAVLLPIQLVLL